MNILIESSTNLAKKIFRNRKHLKIYFFAISDCRHSLLVGSDTDQFATVRTVFRCRKVCISMQQYSHFLAISEGRHPLQVAGRTGYLLNGPTTEPSHMARRLGGKENIYGNKCCTSNMCIYFIYCILVINPRNGQPTVAKIHR